MSSPKSTRKKINGKGELNIITNNFTSTIKDFIIEQLQLLKESKVECYPSDLPSTITEAINMDGSVHFSIAKSREFIYNNWDTFANLIWYCEDELDTPIDALNEPEKLEVIAYIEGTNQLLGSCPTLLNLPDEEVEFTPDILDKLIKEVKEYDGEIDW